MKNVKEISNQWLFLIILVICWQHIRAGMVAKGPTFRNITIAHQVSNEISTTNKTSTINTTVKPELETTTFPVDFDIEGRHAFINNKFVADVDEPSDSFSPPSNNILQPISNIDTESNFKDYNHETPQIKVPFNTDRDEAEKLPTNPIPIYGMGQFDDYDEEETNEYGAENANSPENCEDTQESLGDNDDNREETQGEILENPEENLYQPTFQNKRFGISNYETQTNVNLADSYNTNNFNQQTNISPGILYASKPVAKLERISQSQLSYEQTESNQQYLQSQQTPVEQYGESKPLQHYGLSLPDTYDKPKTPHSSKPHYNIEKTPQLKQETEPNLNKLDYSFYKKPLINYSRNLTDLSHLFGKVNANSNTQTLSPFSTTSVHNKKFKTVSSSIQYVSTPFADLVFKYSIGMAKHSNSKGAYNSSDSRSNIFKIPNYINEKTE